MDSLGNLTSHQELGRAPGSYLLEILPPCQDLGEVWIFLPTAIPLVGHHQQPPFFQGLGSQSTRHDLSHSSYHLFCCPPVIDWESRASSRGSMHCGHYNSATITKVTAAIAQGERGLGDLLIYRTIRRAERDFSCMKETPYQEPPPPMPDNISSSSRTIIPSTRTITISKHSE